MLITMPTVIRTRDSRSIPGAIVAANMGCSLVWVVCGWLLADPLVTGPNIVNLMSCALCIYMKIKYPSQEGNDEDDDVADKLQKSIRRLSARTLKTARGWPGESTPLMAKPSRRGAATATWSPTPSRTPVPTKPLPVSFPSETDDPCGGDSTPSTSAGGPRTSEQRSSICSSDGTGGTF
jgi:hypothetical protein